MWFVLGGPGAGKGTQSALLVERQGYIHLSAGDLLRAERDSGSENGDLINDIIKRGEIVPVEITVNLLKKAMEAAGWSQKFLIDGFPRNQDNVRGWDEVIGDEAEVKGVLFFDCPEEVMLERLLERGKTSGRNDDNEEAARKRFTVYKEHTLPIIEDYASRNKVIKVDGNQEIETVYTFLSNELEAFDSRAPSEQS